MPLANPTTSSPLGPRTAPSAITPPPAHHAALSPLSPLNEQQATNDKPSLTPQSAIPYPQSPRSLFLQVFRLALAVISAIARRMSEDWSCLTLLQGCQAVNCLYSLIRIRTTLDRRPERITPAELRRLARASRYINRLARGAIDFSSYTGSADVSSASVNAGQPASPAPNAPLNEQSLIPQSFLPRFDFTPRTPSGLRAPRLCHAPGATLARVCQSLARLLKRIPDLDYAPFIGSADVSSATPPTPANPTIPSPSLGARTPSSATPPTPANPTTPSPLIPHSEIRAPRLHIPFGIPMRTRFGGP